MSALINELEGNGWTVPDFKNSNLAISKQLANSDKGRLIGQRRKKLFMIIDGMGYGLANEMLGEAGMARRYSDWLNIRELTSIFPSTTGNVLSSIYSGLPTARHGVVGTKVPFKEAGMVVNVLGFSAALGKDLKLWRIDPKTFYPKPKMINGLKKRGVFRSLLNEGILGTGLSTSVFENSDVMPFATFDDMFISINDLAEKGTRYIFAYYDVIDHMQHLYGPDARQPREALHSLFASMKRILKPSIIDDDYDVIITSDHGQTEIPEKNNIEIKSDSRLLDFLDAPPWGEGRSLFVHVAAGKENAFEDYFDSKLGKRAILVDSDEAISSGLFGGAKVDDSLRYRFGTHIILPKDHFAMPYKYPSINTRTPDKFPMVGSHGGLTKEEMGVPLLTNF
jgi:predicted AlkP superfamily pyrophosphatase or phosphodiesterase